MLGQVSILAATAVLGYDLAQNTAWQQSNRTRRLVAVGLAGSAAALDTHARILVGANQVGDLFNAATGAVLKDHMFRFGAGVPPGEEVHVFIDDAPVTNPINLVCDFEE